MLQPSSICCLWCAVPCLPQILSLIRLELALRGVFAGNLFDLGSADSAARFESGGASASTFASTRDELVPRPWVVDHLQHALAAFSKVCIYPT